MVIDTGIGPHNKLVQGVQYENSENYVDRIGHGTHVAGIILYGNENLNDPVCNRVKIYSCKYYDPSFQKGENLKASIECIKKSYSNEDGFY
jgi:subtilisin family serine protease